MTAMDRLHYGYNLRTTCIQNLFLCFLHMMKVGFRGRWIVPTQNKLCYHFVSQQMQ